LQDQIGWFIYEGQGTMIFGYTRISKGEEQNKNLQRKALNEAHVERVFGEQASGARSELQRMLEQLRPGDVVVVWELDRLSRSLKDLLIIMEHIDKAGSGFRSLTESIDTTTPAERMMMQMVGAFAEFEREMIRERTRAGLQAARDLGRIGGRPSKLTNQQRQDIADNVFSGRKSGADMARLYNVSETTVSRIVRQPNLSDKQRVISN
jgi:DNA invertase Pin-like site-specific DNA recombinase